MIDERPLEERVAWTVEEARDALEHGRGYTVDEHTGCYYQTTTTAAGYGSFLTVYIAVFGNPPPGWMVYHRCHGGRRGCIRPSHLDITDGTPIVDADPGLSPLDRNGFAARLRFEREARRATLAQFARELGVSQSTLVDWETNLSSPTQDDFQRISRRLGWDGTLTKWVVTVVSQQTVGAHSAGDAARVAMESLEREQGDRHLALYGVVRASEIPRLRKITKGRALPKPAIDVTMADIIRRARTPEARKARHAARQQARVLNQDEPPRRPAQDSV
jgi:transcriptional regulator with XRE-family HTH domain